MKHNYAFIFIVIFLILVRISSTVPFQSIQYPLSTNSNTITCLQYNIQQRATTEGLLHQVFGIHSLRSYISTIILPRIIATINPDIVCFNEVFTLSLREELARHMYAVGYTHCTCNLNSGWDLTTFFSGKFWPGGVMIFSRFSILSYHTLQFSQAFSADTFAAKGVLYAKINKLGTIYNVFATHTNASYTFSDEAKHVRMTQIHEMAKFVDGFHISDTEAVILAGDFNITKTSADYKKMLNILTAQDPAADKNSWPFSVDSTSNALAERFEQCTLDYILYSTRHLTPTEASNTIIAMKVPNGEFMHQDISDHYPVLSTMSFPTPNLQIH